MQPPLAFPPKAAAGDNVAVLSPSFAAPGLAPEVHEHAMKRLAEVTGLVPVEYPTTRRLGASARDRAADLNAAFADPGIRAVLATTGGEDQITVVPHLDPEIVRADPKPFLGYSDNTNLLSWLAEYTGLFPNAHLVIQPGAGHFPWLDDADRFVATTAGVLGMNHQRIRGQDGAPKCSGSGHPGQVSRDMPE